MYPNIRIKINIALICFVAICAYAQKYMIIDEKNQARHHFLIDNIDSVFFVDYNNGETNGNNEYNPEIVSTYTSSATSSGYEDALVLDDKIYAVGHFGVRAIDISDVNQPKLIAENPLVESLSMKGRSITENGDYLYVVMRQASSGKAEKYVPDIRISFESDLSQYESGVDSISSNGIFNAFFKKLHIESLDAREITKAYLYPARFENNVYRNIIRLNSSSGKSVVFVRNDYATKSESLNALKEFYSNKNGDYCEVDWGAVVENGVSLKNITIYTSNAEKPTFSNNGIVNSFFKKLRISSANSERFKTLYLYKAKKENGVYRNVINFVSDDGKSFAFVREDYASEAEALNSLKKVYKTDNGDYCEVDWSVLSNGVGQRITDFSLFNFGAFDFYSHSANALIDEKASAAPNNSLHAARLMTGSARTASFANLTRNMEELISSGELSFWMKNLNPLQSDVEIPLLKRNGISIANLVLSEGTGTSSIGLKTDQTEIQTPAKINLSEWINIKIVVSEGGISLYYRSQEAGVWNLAATVRGEDFSFDAISIGLKTASPNTEIHIDDLYYSSSNLDGKSYVNGKLAVIQKTDLKIVDMFNLDLKGTGSVIIGDALVVNFLNGYNVYDISSPAHPKLTNWFRSPYFKEYQGCAGYESNGRKYVILCNYRLGYTILDVTDVGHVSVIKVDEGNDLEWDGMNMYNIAYNFDVAVNYPYVYFTNSTARAYLNTEKDVRGIMMMNISDLNDVKKKIISVPKNDLTSSTSGDTRPTRIVKIGNRLLINNADKGILVFEINDKFEPIYKEAVGIPGALNINCLRALKNGSVLAADDNISKKNASLFILKGF